jgi:hypothetical protein
MPQFRQYPQATFLLPTDAFVIDRLGVGTLYVDYSVIGTGGTALTVERNGTVIDAATTVMNFTGAGVTVTDTSPGTVQVNIASGNPLLVVKQNSITVDAATLSMNFTGAGVTVTDASAGNVTVNISGGAVPAAIAWKANGLFTTPSALPFDPLAPCAPSTTWTTVYDTNTGLTTGDPVPGTSSSTLYYVAPVAGYYEVGLFGTYSSAVSSSDLTSLPTTDVFVSITVAAFVDGNNLVAFANGSMTVNNGLPPIANYGTNHAAPTVQVTGSTVVFATAGQKIWLYNYNDYPTTFVPPYGTYVQYNQMTFYGRYIGS